MATNFEIAKSLICLLVKPKNSLYEIFVVSVISVPMIEYNVSRLHLPTIENVQQKDVQDMLSELELMKSLQPHPHVVRLIGCCTKKGNIHPF